MSFDVHDLRKIAHAMRDAAQAEILPRFRSIDNAVREKASRLDLVTDADEAAERHIHRALAGAFPGARIVGEEATAHDPSVLEGLAEAEFAIVVDPIDGTKNYAAGLPLFGVMAAVLQRGVTVAGVIYDPIADDWALALREHGAWLERIDGTRIELHVSRPRPPREMLGIVSWLFMAEPLRSTVTRNLARVGVAVDYRTAAHEYRLIAAGHYDFVMFGKMAPWDHLAGCLLHAEAGGYSACLDGTPYTPASRIDAGLLCAPDKASWIALRDALTS